jgi:hypothetical protein
MADYREFWIEFLKRAPDVVHLYKEVMPKDKSYLHTKKGSYKPFCTAFRTTDNQIWVENCIQEKGKDGKEDSCRKFDHFYSQRDAIEKQFGEQLEWQRLPERKRSRILTEPISFDYGDRSSWDNTIEQILGKMTRFIPAMEKAALGLNTLPKTTTT